MASRNINININIIRDLRKHSSLNPGQYSNYEVSRNTSLVRHMPFLERHLNATILL